MPSFGMHLKFGNDLVFVNKPADWLTHTTHSSQPAPSSPLSQSNDANQPGISALVQAELTSRGINRKIYAIHSLDKYTDLGSTGARVFATTEKRAQDLLNHYKQNQISTRHLFLTQNKLNFSESTQTHIYFKRLKLNALFEQWEAHTKADFLTEIPVQAKIIGANILGDRKNEGAPYPHFCLHTADLEIPGEEKFSCPAPVFFDRMGLIRDSKLAYILSSIDRRQRLFNFLKLPSSCFRLVHNKTNKAMQSAHAADFRMDLFGSRLWIYWYESNPPDDEWLTRFDFVADLLGKKWTLQVMQNRGSDPLSRTVYNPPENSWTACETNQESLNLNFEFRPNQGLSPGLFLDQRHNRQRLIEQVKARKENSPASAIKVLNLFSYTCGFSVAAALAGADEVISVDLSRNFLDWGKQNFRINNLNPDDKSKFNFFAMDSFSFIEKAVKNNRQYDFVIYDPPSFSRNGKDVFRFEKEGLDLLALIFKVIKPGGSLLLSTNFEKMNTDMLLENISLLLRSENLDHVNVQSAWPVGLDYEAPGQEPLMKSFWLQF
jgi:23S rRNA (cytosine1962-C5)-methyltransferase